MLVTKPGEAYCNAQCARYNVLNDWEAMNALDTYLEVVEGAAVKSRQLSTTMDCKPMSAEPLNKHARRTKETRELLLQAAETVFIRDGYERADLVEIAALAGRTKGAIYAQFKSKEEIFFALVEVHALKRRAIMRELLAESNSVEGNLAALREFYVSQAGNDTFGLLILEFRLYTIRHPEARERLATLYRSIVPNNEEAVYTQLLGVPREGEGTISRAAAVHTVFAMLNALQVEIKFKPALFAGGFAKVIAARVFDAIFDPAVEG